MPQAHEVAEKAAERLLATHLDGVTIKVLEAGVRNEEDCWYVPVQPSTEPSKRTEYYEALADVETDLLEQEDLNVLFIPVAALS